MNTKTNAYDNALHNIPAPGGNGCHTALLTAANLGIIAGLSPDAIFTDIRSNIPQGKRKVPDNEIRDAINKAARDVTPATHATGHRTPYRKPAPPAPPPFDGPAYRRKLIARSAGTTTADLSKLSPVAIPSDPAEHTQKLLTTLYTPSDVLFTGTQYGKPVRRVSSILEAIKSGSKIPPNIAPNTFTGKQARTGNDTLSFRCDAAVKDHRFAIVEFDDMPKDEQLCFWHSIITGNLLKVTALIDSGNKSIHAWIAVNLPNAEAWQRVVKDELYHPQTGRMTLLGADRACQNASRLSRMPGHYRADKGKYQRLLYLNPDNQRHTIPAPSPVPPKTSQDAAGIVAAIQASNDTYLQSYPAAWDAERCLLFELSQ